MFSCCIDEDEDLYIKSTYEDIKENKIRNTSPISVIEQINSNLSFETNKYLRFNTIVKVVLIPTKEEYFKAGLGNYIWLNNYDFMNFYISIVIDDSIDLIIENIIKNTVENNIF